MVTYSKACKAVSGQFDHTIVVSDREFAIVLYMVNGREFKEAILVSKLLLSVPNHQWRDYGAGDTKYPSWWKRNAKYCPGKPKGSNTVPFFVIHDRTRYLCYFPVSHINMRCIQIAKG